MIRSEAPPDSQVPLTLSGIGASPGITIGPALVVGGGTPAFKRRHVGREEVDVELRRLAQAVKDSQENLRGVRDRAARAGGEVAILDAYLLMLSDDVLMQATEGNIRVDLKCAEWAVSSAVRALAAHFEDMDDPYLRERGRDMQFVGELIIRTLRGGRDPAPFIKLDRPAVVVAYDLSPADTAAMVNDQVLALVTEIGSRTSHTAIMARALQIPAVLGVADATKRILNGDNLVVDGIRGIVQVRPTIEEIASAHARAARHAELCQHLRNTYELPAETADGVPVELRANLEFLSEAASALECGAMGVGLYRTEFLFINRAEPPSEDEQYEVYRTLVQMIAPNPVTVRTFDIGGDKFVSSLALPGELNPALGLRAVRLALSRPRVFRAQLAAMVRASAHGPVRILVPMIGTLSELRQVRELFESVVRDVDARGLPRAEHIPLGVMVEVPAAAIMIERLAPEADFLSLGTNDLIQYTLAADRANRSLAYLASPFDPAVIRLIANVAAVASRLGTPLSICGEMASDPLAAIFLVGAGIRDLSMDSGGIPRVKETLRRVALDEAQEAAAEAVESDTAEAVEQSLARRFAPRLYDILQEP
jgi:phosphotransferase system enzyme I (PtsI)